MVTPNGCQPLKLTTEESVPKTATMSLTATPSTTIEAKPLLSSHFGKEVMSKFKKAQSLSAGGSFLAAQSNKPSNGGD